jgi:DNA-binding IclR family transcriptional regulator
MWSSGISNRTVSEDTFWPVALSILAPKSSRRSNVLKARAALEGLRNQTGHTVTLGALHDTRVVFVERLHGHKAGQYEVDHDLGVGTNVPLHCTALGKTLFASLTNNERDRLLARIKFTRQGPNAITSKKQFVKAIEKSDPLGGVVSDEELFSGSRSIAALVPHALKYGYVAAIDVTVPSTAFTVEQLVDALGPHLVGTADNISARLGHRRDDEQTS